MNPAPFSGPARRAASAFSLVEVTLAMGVFSFCFVAVFGLLPVGLNTTRDSTEQTAAVGIVRAAVASIQMTANGASSIANFAGSGTTLTLPGADTSAAAAPQTLFFFEDGSSASGAGAVSSGGEPVRYRLDVAYGSRDDAGTPVPVRVLVTWPALANRTPGVWPTKESGRYEVVTSLHP